MLWFGESWGAPICDIVEHVPTPVGELCAWCIEAIEEHDSGVIIPHVELNRVTLQPHHRECFIRETAGSVAHQLRLCGCPGSSGIDHGEMERGLTRREAARLAERCLNRTHSTNSKTLLQ